MALDAFARGRFDIEVFCREVLGIEPNRGRVRVDQFQWRGPQSSFTASGDIALAEGLDGRLKLNGRGSRALATLLVPARVDGRATFDLELTGPPGQRDVRGTIRIEDGSLVEQSWRLAMAYWSGSVVLERDRFDVTGLRGQFNGGEAVVEGHFPIGNGATADESLAVTVRGPFLDLPRGLRSQLDANLEWSHAGGRARVSGDATVTARTYREPITEIARLAGSLIEQSGGSSLQLPAVGHDRADVHLSTVGPLAMTNSVARVELLPDLQLTGTMGRPALRGQMRRTQGGGMKRRAFLVALIGVVASVTPAVAGQWHGHHGYGGYGRGGYWHGPPVYCPAPRVYYAPHVYYPPSYIVVDPIAVGVAVGSMINTIFTGSPERRRYSSGDPVDVGYNDGYNEGLQIGRQQRYDLRVSAGAGSRDPSGTWAPAVGTGPGDGACTLIAYGAVSPPLCSGQRNSTRVAERSLVA